MVQSQVAGEGRLTQSPAGGSGEPPLPLAVRNFNRSAFRRMKSGGVALVIRGSIAFHCGNLRIVQTSWTLAAGDDDVV